MKIAISFLKSKYNTLETIEKIEETNAEYIHVDIMDGEFVPNKTDKFINILNNRKKPLDVHLMVSNPIPYILEYKNLKPGYITIHSEIDNNLNDLIDLIHSYNIKAGISIKPNTNIESIEKYLSIVDNVLIMSVEPGKGGQKFMDSIIYKIDILNKLRKEKKYNYIISIDGGVNDTTIEKTKGVDLVISGSFICENDNYQKQINKLRKKLNTKINKI